MPICCTWEKGGVGGGAERGEEGAEEGEGERGGRPNKDRKEGAMCAHAFWQLYLHVAVYETFITHNHLDDSIYSFSTENPHASGCVAPQTITNKTANWGLYKRALV